MSKSTGRSVPYKTLTLPEDMMPNSAEVINALNEYMVQLLQVGVWFLHRVIMQARCFSVKHEILRLHLWMFRSSKPKKIQSSSSDQLLKSTKENLQSYDINRDCCTRSIKGMSYTHSVYFHMKYHKRLFNMVCSALVKRSHGRKRETLSQS